MMKHALFTMLLGGILIPHLASATGENARSPATPSAQRSQQTHDWSQLCVRPTGNNQQQAPQQSMTSGLQRGQILAIKAGCQAFLSCMRSSQRTNQQQNQQQQQAQQRQEQCKAPADTAFRRASGGRSNRQAQRQQQPQG